MIRLTVNGRRVDVAEGATLLDAALAAGVRLHTLCHHPRLPAQAVCRMCLVEVGGQRQPRAACVTTAKEGDIVHTDTPELQEFRRTNAQWLLAREPNDCRDCEVNGSCQLQTLFVENEVTPSPEHAVRGSPDHPRHRLVDRTSPSIWRELSKCIECGLCAQACGGPGQQQYVIGFADRGFDRLPVTVFDRPLSDTHCISCGQCTLVCPTGALIETPHWHDVLRTLESGRRVCTVQVAPATRIAISEEFGMTPGTVSTGRLINALRRLGFEYVFDTNFAADVTIMEESAELLERLGRRTGLPLLTSCCPAWVNWVEIHRPDLLARLSTTKSPQQMHGALTKRAGFARALGSDFDEGRAEPYVVSIMPCTAKKDETMRPFLSDDIDHVLTTRELARMMKARGIAVDSLPEDGRFDDPLGESTGAAQIFGASGGVMEAMLRNIVHFPGKDDQLSLEFLPLRGVDQSIKTAESPGIGKVAVCNGIAAAQRMFASTDWRDQYVAIEVMACVGGCLGGGGEPKSMDPLVLSKRSQAIYAIDGRASRRRSRENPDVQKLYATELKQPNSVRARELLHTSYAGRGSPRLLLMRFLDCVDRRDSVAAAELLHPDATWSTASQFGEVQGVASIQTLIASRLPPRLHGPAFARHRMECPSDSDDMTVVAPTGERCRFSVDTETIRDAGQSRLVIRRLARLPA